MEDILFQFATAGISEPIRYRLSEGVHPLSIGGRQALFSAGSERLYELNVTAALLASMLYEGSAFAALTAALECQGFDGEAASGTVLELLRQWSAQNLVHAAICTPDAPQFWEQRIHIAGVDAAIHYADIEQYRQISPIFAHMSRLISEPATCIKVVEADGVALVSRNGGPAWVIAASQAGPFIRGLLVEDVLAVAPPDIALHTACLAHRNRALLLGGPPGAGKTTLTIALSRSGFDYVSDDITLLRRDGRVQGVPFAPAVKEGAWPLLRRYRADVATLPVHMRLDDVPVRYPGLTQPPHIAHMNAGWIVHLRRVAGATPEFRELDPVEALVRLMDEAHSTAGAATIEDMRTLIALVERVRCFELTCWDLDAAVEALSVLCAEG
jgi:GTPase SAR1 family protein